MRSGSKVTISNLKIMILARKSFQIKRASLEGVGGEWAWEFWISRCKLSYVGQINNKVLLHSTGNYIQYPVISQNGKEYGENMPN